MNGNMVRELCIKSITGNINEAEKELLSKWLNESQFNKKEFENMEAVWNSTLPGSPAELPTAEIEWTGLSDRIRQTESKKVTSIEINNIIEQTPFEKLAEFIRYIFIPKLKPVISAAVILFFIISGIILLGKHPAIAEIKTISTGANQRMNFSLPDGSKINLNTNSTIEYPAAFGKKDREVKLHGEAFFSVARDVKHPFVITTGNAKVTVLGTKFDVCSSGERTRVSVKEGKVKLADEGNGFKSVRLSSGQVGIIIKNEAPVTENAGFNYLPGWINGRLTFNRTRMSAVLSELERFYNIKIKHYDQDISSLTLTGTFTSSDADSVLTMICLAEDLKFKKQNDGYVIQLK